jgi:K+/H+ antiporter YhaU regulatory subunit KhtT
MSNSIKSYEGNKSQRSKGIIEDNENIKELMSSSKSKHSSNIKLSKKRERAEEDTEILEKAYKEKNISESQKQFIEVNEMSATQIGREKD